MFSRKQVEAVHEAQGGVEVVEGILESTQGGSARAVFHPFVSPVKDVVKVKSTDSNGPIDDTFKCTYSMYESRV